MLFILLWTLTVLFTWQWMGQSQASKDQKRFRFRACKMSWKLNDVYFWCKKLDWHNREATRQKKKWSSMIFSPQTLMNVWVLTCAGCRACVWTRMARTAATAYRASERPDRGASAEVRQMNRFILLFCSEQCCQTINHIQNKSFCLHDICVCTVYIYYV